ncbi:cysteine desulfurase family protein [Gulosibacter massiliensis]|uniref:cysteine desulfurase family protein n=1 Tax=Gulosibacter massiliensis TaxID=2479839 RepID=UPI000F637ECC|nr:cysteine desulfurase family protein [Gulosibacter massiliensis]
MPIYLDHAATTPMRPAARAAWLAAHERVGNPASIHAHGQSARASLEVARERLARHLGAQAIEVVLTSGGTEAINLALKGFWWAQNANPGAPTRPRILTTRAEHHATLDAVEWLVARQGAEVEFVPVDAVGRVDLAALERLLESDAARTAVISVLHANNEVGTVQPVREIGELGRRFGVPVHIDAVASLGHEDVDLRGWGVQAVSVSAHKVGGPVGVGALVVSRDATVEALVHGGGQQRGLRSGTQDVAGAAAFAAALDEAVAPGERERLRGLRDELIRGIRAAAPEARLRGADPETDAAGRLVNNVHFTFPGAQGDSLLFLLDMAQLSASTGSACQAGIPEPSHVLLAMGDDEATARGALRFTLGWDSTPADVEALLAALPGAYETARRAGLSNRPR